MKRTILAPILLIIAAFAINRALYPLVPSPAGRSFAPAGLITAGKGWTKTWGGAGDERVNRTAVDAAGNVYVVGEFAGTVDFDPSPAKTRFYTSYNNTLDAFISKFDANGSLLWAKTWGGSKRDVAYGVGLDSAGNAYVVGPFMDTVDFNPDPVSTDWHTSNGISGTIYQNNIFLSKFAADGTYQWVRTWGPSYVPGAAGGAEGYTVAVDGNYLYVVGDFSGGTTDFNPWGTHDYHTNHPPVSGPIFFDAFLSKFDLNGNFQWAKTWGGEGYDDGPGVAVDQAGNVYVAGMYASQTINFDPAGGAGGLGHPAHDSGILVDVFLSKFDSAGNFIWVKTWGGQGVEDAMGTVIIDAANQVYVAGRFASLDCDFDPGTDEDLHSTHNGSQDAFVSKFAPDGSFVWARTWGGSSSENAIGLALDQWGYIYVSGWYSDLVDFNPGEGVDNRRSNQKQDAFVSQFDADGNYRWARTWGGSGDDSSSVAIWGERLYAGGQFASTVDFDPGSGDDSHTSNGGSDAFLSQFWLLSQHVYLPLVSRR